MAVEVRRNLAVGRDARNDVGGFMFLIALTAAATLLQAQDAPQRIRIGGNVQAANLIKKVTPVYPPLAKQARVQGTVRFTVILSKEGDVMNMQLVSGHPLLVPSATEAVQQWKYKPTLLNGNPVEVITQIDVNYTLSDDSPWIVSWRFLSRFRVSGEEEMKPDSRPARLAADGGLHRGEETLRARFQPLNIDGLPMTASVYFAAQAEGMPDVIASWPQMSQRILARREGVKPRADLEGKVFVEVIVNRDGNVEKVLRVNGSEELRAAAETAVMDWKFRPVVINGEACAVRTTIPLEF
jgi:TonB family protein